MRSSDNCRTGVTSRMRPLIIHRICPHIHCSTNTSDHSVFVFSASWAAFNLCPMIFAPTCWTEKMATGRQVRKATKRDHTERNTDVTYVHGRSFDTEVPAFLILCESVLEPATWRATIVEGGSSAGSKTRTIAQGWRD